MNILYLDNRFKKDNNERYIASIDLTDMISLMQDTTKKNRRLLLGNGITNNLTNIAIEKKWK